MDAFEKLKKKKKLKKKLQKKKKKKKKNSSSSREYSFSFLTSPKRPVLLLFKVSPLSSSSVSSQSSSSVFSLRGRGRSLKSGVNTRGHHLQQQEQIRRRRFRRRPVAKRVKMSTVSVVSSSNEEDQEAKKVVTFVTGNAKKLEEVKSILKLASTDEEDKGGKMMKINLISRSIDLPELQGDPIDIAKEKCLLASREIEGPTLVEDTSLCFNALKGLPGPYVKWFLEKTGLDGLNNMLLAYEDKTAYAQCVFAYCEGGEKNAEEVEVFVGRTNGRIVKARGKTEFGWDAVFEPDEQRDVDDKKTYGEMEKEEKNAISHRFRALEKLREAKFR